jgi:hypothetical protein
LISGAPFGASVSQDDYLWAAGPDPPPPQPLDRQNNAIGCHAQMQLLQVYYFLILRGIFLLRRHLAGRTTLSTADEI